MIRSIAIDDEPLALKRIQLYAEKIPYLEIVALCHDTYEAMKVLEEENIDLMFVDINMPDINGMEFVKSMRTKPYIIFTTAYSEYAIEGYKVEAVGYLLKPYTFEEMQSAVANVYELLKKQSVETKAADDDYLFVKCDYKMQRVNLSDIIYAEGMSEYVKIYIEGAEKPLVPLLSMKRLEEKLPDNKFVRVHKSFIVNVSKIQTISRMRIYFGDKIIVPIGDGYKDRLFQKINDKMLG